MEISSSPRELTGSYGLEQVLRQSGEDIKLSWALWRPLPDLVNSVGARAHLYEEQGSYSSSLSDREILRTINNRYPDLPFEVRALGENTRPANPRRIQNAAR